MITIQIPGPHQEVALKQFAALHRLSVESTALPEESMILTEDGEILGYASYKRNGVSAVITMLFIAPAMRKMDFGDGLFRGLVNLMERNGVGKFYVPANENLTGFLEAEELVLSNEGPEWIESSLSATPWYEGTLPEFFQKPCKGGHDS